MCDIRRESQRVIQRPAPEPLDHDDKGLLRQVPRQLAIRGLRQEDLHDTALETFHQRFFRGRVATGHALREACGNVGR